jgi:two-component system sensor histidine kinase KdpD
VWVVAEILAYAGLAALAARLAEPMLDPPSLALFFVAPILLAAIRFGFWASIGAALLGTLAVNFLFVEPRYTFVVARPQDAMALTLFATVGALASIIAAQARTHALRASARAVEAELLQVYATRLAACGDEDQIAAVAAETLSRLADRPALLVFSDGRASAPHPSADAQESAKWAMSTKQPVIASSPEGVLTEWSFWPILQGRSATCALGFGDAREAPRELEAVAEQIAAHASVALERARMAREAEEGRLDAARERFKSLLLAGVSHDLRTPLATIVFTLQSLQRFSDAHVQEGRDELLALAEKEARRLAGLVETLLDASRIEAGATPVHLEDVSLLHVIEQALAEVDAPGRIEVRAATGLPNVRADAALAAHALASVVHNALRHAAPAAPDEPIIVDASAGADEIVMEVSDRGPGLGDNPERLFGKFVRGTPGDGRVPGLGLGLSIASGLLECQGGRIAAFNRDGGGATFRISLPRCDAR